MSPSEPAADVEVALVTAPDADTADRIARTLLDERLAACVNLVPQVRSLYRWKGVVESAEEVLLVVKTRADRAQELERRVVALHPYDVPEVLRLSGVDGHPAYLRWVTEESAP